MEKYLLSIRCYYPGCPKYSHHLQELELDQIGKWVEAYRFTHPKVSGIMIQIVFDRKAEEE